MSSDLPGDAKPIPGFPDYHATTSGEIWSMKSGAPTRLKPSANETGHLHVVLFVDGESNTKFVHHLILMTFDRARCSRFEVCRHLNGDPSDNCLENLRWGSSYENYLDSVRHGTAQIGENSAHSKLTRDQVIDIRSRYEEGELTQSELAREHDVTPSCIYDILNGYTWAHLDKCPVEEYDGERGCPRPPKRKKRSLEQALANMSDETGESQAAIVRRAVVEAVANYESQKRLEEMSDN